METTPTSSGDRPGGDMPPRNPAAPSGDVLEEVLRRFAMIQAGSTARTLIAQVLAATLASFTRTRSVRDPLIDTAPESAEEALAALAGIDQLRASLAAVDVTWQAVAEQRIRRSDADRGLPADRQGRGAGQEIALARRISPAASSFSLARARRLAQDMPGTVEALWSGAVTDQQASTVAGALDGAGAETCRRIDDRIREHPEFLHGKGKRRLQSDVRALVQQLEPETSRERAERAARSRHVTMTPLDDGMARVSATLRAIDAVAMMASLRSRAESRRASGSRTSVPALEADLLVEDVLQGALNDGGGSDAPGTVGSGASDEEAGEKGTAGSGAIEERATAPRRPRPRPGLDVGIVITETALLGQDDDAETALLEGYGTLPAHIVQDTLLGRPPGHLRHDEAEHPDEEVSAFFRRLYAAPRAGDLVAMESTARAFPAGLARMLRWRDTTCRTPWCNATIRHSDHVVPVQHGGPTSYANGQGLCARCNLLKEHGLWVLTPLSRAGTEPGSVDPAEAPPPSTTPPAAWAWTSPHGATGISPTPPLIAPSLDHPPPDDDRREPDAPVPPGDPGDPVRPVGTEPPENSQSP
ncbi:DUF222 domain-containing protein [Brachybacterium sp. AOP43-C2-M15]|uniref:DUF222 domain-containing protein n=1 Tax=Brachybacterium sp. AOP43-C2-M15 TaxID=3457661 RepID=UPI0040344272